MAFNLNQQTSHGLQYFADDYAKWLDAISRASDSTEIVDSRPEDIQAIQLDETTTESNYSSFSTAGAEAMHIECVVLKGEWSSPSDLLVVVFSLIYRIS